MYAPAVDPAWQLEVSMNRFTLRELLLDLTESCNARWHYLVELMSIGRPAHCADGMARVRSSGQAALRQVVYS